MSLIDVILMVGKAFFVVMFAMNVAVLFTWVDRRQGAMLQDRIGPHRAVAWLPRRVAQALAFLPAAAVALGALAFAYTGRDDAGSKSAMAMVFSQLAILMTWMTGVVIAGAVRRRGAQSSFDVFVRSLGDPRSIVYAGLLAHLGTFLVAGLLSGTAGGQHLRDAAYGAGAGIFAAVVLGGAVYAVLQMKDERIGLRLAGLLHPAADGLKTAFKEDFIPPGADRLLHSIAPFLSFFPPLVLLAVVPFGDTLCFGTTKEGGIDITKLAKVVPRDGVCVDGAVPLQAVDVNVGILFFFALAGTGIVGAALAGWASNNKYSLLGGLRAASQMVSYEVTLGLTLAGAFMIYGTLRVDDMVRWQAENAWGIFVQPFAFFLFFAALIAESKRIPFDIPEGESELVAGYFTEYSGMKFAMFFFSEYIAMVTGSAVMAALFFGGWDLPFVYRNGIHVAIGDTVLFSQTLSHGFVVLLGVLGFIGKTIALCWLHTVIRWSLPRFRYDQLMKLGWRKLLPASLVNIMATGLLILAVQGASPAFQRGLSTAASLAEAAVALAGIAAVVALFRYALKPAEHRRVLSSTSAKFAALAGGTRSARLGA